MSAHREWALQQTVATFLARALPLEAWWTSVDAGQGKMDLIAAARRRNRGVKAGVPDVLLCWSGQFRTIELKVDDGRLSENQRIQAEQIILAGGDATVCTSVEEVEWALKHWKWPLRATSFPAAEYDARREARLAAPKKAYRAPKKPADRGGISMQVRNARKGLFTG
jgi:hypothetical protein